MADPVKRWLLKVTLVVMVAAGLAAMPPGLALAATVAHIYELNGSLADSLGGPALVAAGGTLNATNYSFAANQGLSLLNGLANALGFGAEELMGNRAGTLHAAQASRFAREYLMGPAFGVFLSLITPVLIRYFWAAVVEHRSLLRFTMTVLQRPSSFLMQMNSGIEEPLPFVLGLTYLIFPLFAIHFMMKIRWKVVMDVLSTKVKKDSGPVCVRWEEKRLRGKNGREGDLVSRYSYFVNGHEYRVSRAAYEALVPQIHYNLYYMAMSKIVVSAEPVDLAARRVQAGIVGILVIR